jgi:hypothetical protein
MHVWRPGILNINKVTFYRRKPDAECFVGNIYQQLNPVLKPCECTKDDFECDQYHYKKDDNCVLIEDIKIPTPVCKNGIKLNSKGYIKKKISSCAGGLDLSPISESCKQAGFSLVFWIFAVPIAIGILYLFNVYNSCGMGRYGGIALPTETQYNRPSVLRNSVDFIKDGILYVGALIGWAWDSLKNTINRKRGYQQLNTHYYDTDLPTGSNSRESVALVWEDDAVS